MKTPPLVNMDEKAKQKFQKRKLRKGKRSQRHHEIPKKFQHQQSKKGIEIPERIKNLVMASPMPGNHLRDWTIVPPKKRKKK